MRLNRFAFILILISQAAAGLNAQSVDRSDTLTRHLIISKPLWKQMIVPAGLIVYGAAAINAHPLLELNDEYKEEVYLEHPHALIHADNYIQFAPAVAVFALNLAGIKGRNNLFDASMIYVLSNVFLNSSVTFVKHQTHILRPDGSDYYSFPSGHTAEAFASAEFLREEYRGVSAWYGFAGYAMAFTTGFLRTYNNKHWVNDVVAGAGFGIASTRLSYWLYPKIKNLFYKNKPVRSVFMPGYTNGAYTLNFIYKL